MIAAHIQLPENVLGNPVIPVPAPAQNGHIFVPVASSWGQSSVELGFCSQQMLETS